MSRTPRRASPDLRAPRLLWAGSWPPQERPSRGRLHGAFTLVELLAVMVVMIILFALGVGVFIRVNAGSAMRSAAGSLQTAVALARQHAVSTGQATYVVTLPRDLDFAGMESLRSLAANGYAVYAVTNPIPGSMEGRWLTAWRKLPERVVLDDDPGLPDSWFAAGNVVDRFPVPGDAAGTTQERALPACAFLPSGRTPVPGGYRIYLVEGSLRVNEARILKTVPGQAVEIRVNGLTGLARVTYLQPEP